MRTILEYVDTLLAATLEVEKRTLMGQNPYVVEWLDTNKYGSYASSTVSGCHTRKYHGLLVARLPYPKGKYVLLSKLEDSLFWEEKEIFLTAHQYPGALFPGEGLPRLSFSNERWPTFKYQAGTVNLQKEILLVEDKNAVLVKYTCTKNSNGAALRIKPMLAYRDFHGLVRENFALRVRTFPLNNGFLVNPYEGMPPLNMQTTGKFEFFPSPTWYHNFEYLEEARRGFDFREDLFSPGVFEMPLAKGDEIIISGAVDVLDDLTEIWEAEAERRRDQFQKLRGSKLQKSLRRAAHQFITENPAAEDDARGRKAVTAGYHWFAEWGRDAMIALPGLLLTNGGAEVYLDVLKRFAEQRRRGIIPNYLGETPGENAYNSADAGLWFAYAVQQYLEHVGKPTHLRGEIAEALYDIYRNYQDGTDYGIHMLDNGLLWVGSPHEQVTWMDAMVNGRPVTPRFGCPVEINALWYNFVAFIAEKGPSLTMRQKIAEEATALVEKIKMSFNETFWISDGEYLGDLKQGEWLDRANRPNQIFAASMPNSPLSEERARKVVEKVTATLYTPFGLRTLDPADSAYRGRYEGDGAARDSAYHNGTVWPWLIGHFGEALLKHSYDMENAFKIIEASLAAFESHLDDAGLGTISEIFDGDAPQGARGCVSQAWSVAEILRLSTLLDSARKAFARRNT